MNLTCEYLHRSICHLPTIDFDEISRRESLTGIYFSLDTNELGHGVPRIVRIGTHNQRGGLIRRIINHTGTQNKDRSIFRKHIGRAILSKNNDPYLKIWNQKSTKPSVHRTPFHENNRLKQQKIENKVSEYLNENVRFVAFPIDEIRLLKLIERKLIATVSNCKFCGPSPDWLGMHHPNKKLSESGLWNVQHIFAQT